MTASSSCLTKPRTVIAPFRRVPSTGRRVRARSRAVGVRLDLDEHARIHETRHREPRGSRPDRSEQLRVRASDGVLVADVLEAHPRADDVVEREPVLRANSADDAAWLAGRGVRR